MTSTTLTEREERILGAVVRTYVRTAEPVGSRRVVRRFDLGISAATVRNTMADLEEKGYLYQPHTSAGRVPTDRAYRYYVDKLMRPALSSAEQRRIAAELDDGDAGALDRLVRRAARVIGVLTGELGVAIGPPAGPAGDGLHLGRASVLARQPEFADGSELRRLIELTERRELLTAILAARERDRERRITIGREHPYVELDRFAVVTSPYRVAGVFGVLGVIGPTRMPYDTVAAVVDRASFLISEMPGPSVTA